MQKSEELQRIGISLGQIGPISIRIKANFGILFLLNLEGVSVSQLLSIFSGKLDKLVLTTQLKGSKKCTVYASS